MGREEHEWREKSGYGALVVMKARGGSCGNKESGIRNGKRLCRSTVLGND